MAIEQLSHLFRVEPGDKVRLRDWDPAWAGTKQMRKLRGDQLKVEAQTIIKKNLERLADAQELLWAADKYALLVVLQGMDAAGKDGMISHVMRGLNPQACEVSSFKQPTGEELEHDFLWRISQRLPARGRIGIFNRSHYEEVLVVRVHPDRLANQNLSVKLGNAFWEQRYQDINCFERHLARNRTVILKFFLHISRSEQKRRFLERLENPKKQWKFSVGDLAERARWKDYVEAYEDALAETSSKHAPWYIIPSDHKWVARWAVSEILTETVQRLDLKLPKLTKEKRAALQNASKLLKHE